MHCANVVSKNLNFDFSANAQTEGNPNKQIRIVKNTFLAIYFALTAASGVQAQELTQIANLHEDFNSALAANPSLGETFSENGWSLWQGGAELQFDADLANGAAWQTVAGYKGVAGGNGTDVTLELGHVAADGVFDNHSAAEGEIAFHPSFQSGPNADTIIRWTADKAYESIDFEYMYRRGAVGSTGVAIRFIDGGVDSGFVVNEGNVSTQAVTGVITCNQVEAGDYIEVILYAGGGGAADDQSFGNFVVKAPPEPVRGSVIMISSISGWIVVWAALILCPGVKRSRNSK